MHHVVGPLGGEPRRDRHQPRRRHGRDQRGGAQRARGEQPLDHGGAHRVPDQHRRDRELARRPARRRRHSRRGRRRTASRGRRKRRGRAAKPRARRSPIRRTTAGNRAPSTSCRCSRRGRRAAAACGRCRRSCRRRARAGGSGLRGCSSAGSMRLVGWDPARGSHGSARASICALPCPQSRKSPPFCQIRDGCRSTTPDAAAARGWRRSSTRCAPRIRRYFCRPVPPFGAAGCAAGHRRPRAGNARRQRQRAAVHRRSCRHPALRDAARLRLRLAAARRRARRRAGADRLPDHQRGEMPAAREQAAAGGDPRLQRLPRRRSRDACPTAARSSRSAASRTRRRCGRSRAGQAVFAHGARASSCDRGIALFDSYHCSRYNTNTRRLTPAMFRSVFDAVARHLGRDGPRRAAGRSPRRGCAMTAPRRCPRRRSASRRRHSTRAS